jgi:cobalt/nickel transport system permease protein
VLVAALLGPSAAVIVLSTVLIVQCFAFADGGITALGANIFNMGIIGGAMGGMLYLLISRFIPGLFGRLVAAMVASWASVVMAAIVCAGELASSGTAAWRIAFPAMAGVHALIGIGEGLITALVLSAIASVRPELVLPNGGSGSTDIGRSLKPVLVFGALASLGIAMFLAPFASGLPDGLKRVAQGPGFDAQEKAHSSLFSDYTPLAATIATLLLFPLAWFVARALMPKSKPASPSVTPSR